MQPCVFGCNILGHGFCAAPLALPWPLTDRVRSTTYEYLATCLAPTKLGNSGAADPPRPLEQGIASVTNEWTPESTTPSPHSTPYCMIRDQRRRK